MKKICTFKIINVNIKFKFNVTFWYFLFTYFFVFLLVKMWVKFFKFFTLGMCRNV